MEEFSLSIPSLWGDHHVVAVRDILYSLEGVERVDASSMRHQVCVTFDPESITRERIVESLAGSGYAPDAAGEGGEAAPQPSSWGRCGSRITETNPVDLAMSGDHRKY